MIEWAVRNRENIEHEVDQKVLFVLKAGICFRTASCETNIVLNNIKGL